jgi:gamma-D-glutamyl-L-lysine dipeptidyl-peptidase
VRCRLAIAAVRKLPDADAEQVTQALLHEPLELRGRSGEWVSIVTAYGYPGWILAEAVEDAPGTLPGPSQVDPLAIARDLVGAPYEWGGLTGHGIDCSGLVHIAYRLSGRLVPRDSWQQEAAGVKVAPGEERRGDVVSYGGGERADHVAFWLGAGRILHATGREGLGVVEEQEPAELSARRRIVFRL